MEKGSPARELFPALSPLSPRVWLLSSSPQYCGVCWGPINNQVLPSPLGWNRVPGPDSSVLQKQNFSLLANTTRHHKLQCIVKLRAGAWVADTSVRPSPSSSPEHTCLTIMVYRTAQSWFFWLIPTTNVTCHSCTLILVLILT